MNPETLLFEIGTEELPAGYLTPALDLLASLLKEKLTAARVRFGQVNVYGTPRRLTVMIQDVAARQADVSETLTGPPVKIGVDASGNFTMPARKFAEKAGVSVKALQTMTTDKGEYLSATRMEKGQSVKTVLKALLPQALSSLSFPKTMRWGDEKAHFARPVRSLLAMLGKSVVSFSWAGINSGRYASGHPFMSPQRIKIVDPDHYLESLRKAHVIADIKTRRDMVIKEIDRITASLGGRMLPDEELIDTVTNMVEFPVAASGRFGEKYLALPHEVLITAMRSHQKYFAVVDEENRLLPSFIVINNNQAADMSQVTRGHERVLRARLEDAMFFYEKDKRIPLGDRAESLKRVLFQARLGSLYDKAERIKALGKELIDLLGMSDTALQADLLRAGQLCKADLVTQMVIEFPKLQGIMGRIYALTGGENQIVSRAIEEHYQPAFSGAALPGSLCGALLAIVDKIDTICGCFAIGLVPSGASDPYALRRQGIGIIQILLDQGLSLSVNRLVTVAIHPYADLMEKDPAQIAADIVGFLRGRMAQLLVDEAIPKDIVNAVLNASTDNIPDVWNRARTLSAIRSRLDFEPLAVAFKRVANIIKKTNKDNIGPVDESLFQHPSENRLYHTCQDTAGKMAASLEQGRYEQALAEMAAMRPVVDSFFDDVLVMDEDPALRTNRLALLLHVSTLFSGFADFSVIVTDARGK